jgi:hypothetical protein
MLAKPLKINVLPSSKWKFAIVFGLLMQTLIFLAVFSGFVCIAWIGFKDGIGLGILATILLLGLLYFLKRLIQSNYFFESIEVNSYDLIVVIRSAVHEKRYSIPLKNIEYFGAATQDFYNDAHMPFVQALTIPDRQKKYLVNDGRMEIRTEQTIYRFGVNMVSWDIDEIVRKVELHAGIIFALQHQSKKTEYNI